MREWHDVHTNTHTRWDEKHRFDLFRASHFNKKWRKIERKNINDMKRTHTHTRTPTWLVSQIMNDVLSPIMFLVCICLSYYYVFSIQFHTCLIIFMYTLFLPSSSHHFMYYFSWNVPHILTFARTTNVKLQKKIVSSVFHLCCTQQRSFAQFYQSRKRTGYNYTVNM